MDTECLKPHDEMLKLSDVLLGRMGSDIFFTHSIPNAIMASATLQEFWLLVSYLVIDCANESWPPEYLAGPVVLKRAVEL
jgi:inositol phosphorylceramide mannosyltransferase catalytic subunit